MAALYDSAAVRSVLVERQRQISVEGYDHSHDDQHAVAHLAAAAGCYALFADSYPNTGEPPPQWPWEAAAWKPKDFRRDLVRAAALALAAIDNYDRTMAPYGFRPL